MFWIATDTGELLNLQHVVKIIPTPAATPSDMWMLQVGLSNGEKRNLPGFYRHHSEAVDAALEIVSRSA